MAILTAAQLTAVTTIRGGDFEKNHAFLYVPAGHGGPVAGNLARITASACWNWALCAGLEGNPGADTSPVTLYGEVGLQDNAGQYRAALGVNYATEPTLGDLWATAGAAYGDLPADDPDRIAFMTAMARVAARANGLTPQAAASPYRIHVTTTRAQWYGWSHWALSITHGGRTRYIQKEPNRPLTWGHDRLWEADRVGYLNTSFYVTDIHQGHLDVIECFLAMARCRVCQRVKPENTALSRWHRCSGPLAHTYCPACGGQLRMVQSYAVRTCNAAPCVAATARMGDP